MLYQVAIVEKATPQGAKSGKSDRIILEPKAVVAKDESAAAIKASRGVSFEGVNEAMMEVIVIPFAS